MTSQLMANLIYLGIVGFFAGLIVLSFPWRRLRRTSLQLDIAAPRQKVWDTYVTNPDDPRSAALHPNTVSYQQDPNSPNIFETIYDASKGHRTNLMSLRVEVLEERSPERRASRIVDVDGKPFPFGAGQLTTEEFIEIPDGTRLVHRFQGETASLWQYFAILIAHRNYFHQLKKISEAENIPEPADKPRFPLKTLALSAVAFGSFALWVGWIGALILVGVLVVHEFGHWLAFRMSGHPSPRIMLIPFLGGVAVGNHPHKSRFDEAFCALMGPAFSIVPCAILLVAAVTLVPPWLTAVPGWYEFAREMGVEGKWAVAMAGLVLAVGAINLLQMLPMLPLDGGQVLRALMHSFSAVWARRVLLVLAALAFIGFVWLDDYIIAAVAALGGLGAWQMNSTPSDVRPMCALSASAIGIGYTVTFAVHAGATIFGLWALGILPDLIIG